MGFSWQVCDAKHSHEEKGKFGEEDPVFSIPIQEHGLLYPSLRLGLWCLGILSESELHPLLEVPGIKTTFNPGLGVGWAQAEPPPAVAVPQGCCKTLCKPLCLLRSCSKPFPVSRTPSQGVPAAPNSPRAPRRMKFNM